MHTYFYLFFSSRGETKIVSWWNGGSKNFRFWLFSSYRQKLAGRLSAFASDSSRQLDILRHDGDSLGVDGAQVGVFEQANQVRFGRFLQRQDRGGLESQVSLEILGDFSDQSLERQLSDEQFRGLLVLADFSQRDGTRAVSVRLLDATSRRRRFARGLSRELLSRGFATGGFTSSLFGTSHCVWFIMKILLCQTIHLNLENGKKVWNQDFTFGTTSDVSLIHINRNFLRRKIYWISIEQAQARSNP